MFRKRHTVEYDLDVLQCHLTELRTVRDEGRAITNRNADAGVMAVTDDERANMGREDHVVSAALLAIWESTGLDVCLTSSWDPWIVTLSDLSGAMLDESGYIVVNATGTSYESAADALVRVIEAAIPQLTAALEPFPARIPA